MWGYVLFVYLYGVYMWYMYTCTASAHVFVGLVWHVCVVCSVCVCVVYVCDVYLCMYIHRPVFLIWLGVCVCVHEHMCWFGLVSWHR